MADLIGRKVAIEKIKSYEKSEISAGRKTIDPVDDIIKISRMISAIPVVDAAPVVRCKDCKHAIIQGSFGPGTVLCRENNTIYPLNGFCSKGTKKGGEENDD